MSKFTCDNTFYSCMNAVCDKLGFWQLSTKQMCKQQAGAYWTGVSVGGCSAYSSAQQYTCTCAAAPSPPPRRSQSTPAFVIQHRSSGACIHTHNGGWSVPDGNPLITWRDCPTNEPRLQFRLLADVQLQHVLSGKCIHPSGGRSNPDNGTPLVLFSGCESSAKLR
jgi:hypothetical protein